eukprot:16412467-Heterocapsa_arctica.AAC.1
MLEGGLAEILLERFPQIGSLVLIDSIMRYISSDDNKWVAMHVYFDLHHVTINLLVIVSIFLHGSLVTKSNPMILVIGGGIGREQE